MKWKQKIVAIAMAIMLVGGTVTTVSVLPGTAISMEVSAAEVGTLYYVTAPDWLALRGSDSTK